jgi:hypothetical protein
LPGPCSGAIDAESWIGVGGIRLPVSLIHDWSVLGL